MRDPAREYEDMSRRSQPTRGSTQDTFTLTMGRLYEDFKTLFLGNQKRTEEAVGCQLRQSAGST